MWCEAHICGLSSAAGHYATKGEETQDTGKSAKLVIVHLTDQGATLLWCPISHPSSLTLRRNRHATPTRSRLVLLQMAPGKERRRHIVAELC